MAFRERTALWRLYGNTSLRKNYQNFQKRHKRLNSYNNLDLKQYEIVSFGIPKLNFDDKIISEIGELYESYLLDIERNVQVRQTERYANIDTFKEYKIGKSKHLIDRLDDIICPLYGLTPEETDFVKNYEIEFRLSENN